MSDRLTHRPGELSGGEQQRVAIARALVMKPRLLMADEPTGNLDTKNSDGIVDLIRQINDEGVTFVVITHNQEIAQAFPRTAGLRDGLIEYDSGRQQ
jgi:ABC-type lipoprotein export system ATPase subunit